MAAEPTFSASGTSKDRANVNASHFAVLRVTRSNNLHCSDLTLDIGRRRERERADRDEVATRLLRVPEPQPASAG